MSYRLIVVLALSLAVAVCGDEGSELSNVEPNLSSLQSKVFNKTCVDSSCHNATDAAGDLVLAAGKSYAEMVSVETHLRGKDGYYIVDPGNPGNSTLYVKLIGNELGNRMPTGRPRLPNNVIAAVKQWIADGAPNN